MVYRLVLVAVAAAVVFAGLSGGASRLEQVETTSAERRVILQLGRPICGDCCVEQVQRAFLGLPGIEGVSMNPGDVDFVVRLGEDGPAADELVVALVREGVRGARVSPHDRGDAVGKFWVTAR